MICIICKKKVDFLRKGCCSPNCAWEFLARNKTYKNPSIDLIETKNDKSRIEIFAEKLNANMPESEKWFWKKWIESGLSSKDDIPNKVFNDKFIPDITNEVKKYVIEIDGKIHKFKKLKDHQKDVYYRSYGYEVFRIKADSDDSYNCFVTKYKKYVGLLKENMSETDKIKEIMSRTKLRKKQI